jgi:hypothetical protein
MKTLEQKTKRKETENKHTSFIKNSCQKRVFVYRKKVYKEVLLPSLFNYADGTVFD